MNKYDFKIQKLSKKADTKIKKMLYIEIFKKRISYLFNLKNLSFAVPVIALFAFWIFSYWDLLQYKNLNIKGNTQEAIVYNLSETEKKPIFVIWWDLGAPEIEKFDEVSNYSLNNYNFIAKDRVLKAKLNYYKKYSTIRKIKSFAMAY